MTSAGWPSLPLKRVVDSVQSGTSVNGAPWPAQDDQLGVLKTSAVYGGVFNPTENKEVESYDLDRVSCPVLAGSLIVSRMNTPQHLGLAAAVNQDFPNLYLPDRLWAVTFSGAEPRFVDWWTKTAAYRAQVEAVSVGTSSSMQNISQGDFLEIHIELPDLETQRAIANYLDRETARIDTLIEEQQRLIEMLRERRVAVIDVTVWLGLDSKALYAPTGLDSAPAAPAHWRRIRNKNLYFESSAVSADGNEELLTVSHLTGITPRSEKQKVNMFEAESLQGYRLVEPGDLVINTMWAWMGALGVSKLSGLVSPAYGVYRPLADVDAEPRYLDYLYRSRPYVVEMTRHSRGIWESRLRLYPESFLRLPTVIPPLAEQLRIATYLDKQIAKIDVLIAEAERFVELSRERRAALITAAVTGEIDVREMV